MFRIFLDLHTVEPAATYRFSKESLANLINVSANRKKAINIKKKIAHTLSGLRGVCFWY